MEIQRLRLHYKKVMLIGAYINQFHLSNVTILVRKLTLLHNISAAIANTNLCKMGA